MDVASLPFCLSKYLPVLYFPFFLWWCEMIQCVCDEMKRGEWRRHRDVVWGFYWPSDHSWAGGPPAFRPPETGESKTMGKRGITINRTESCKDSLLFITYKIATHILPKKIKSSQPGFQNYPSLPTQIYSFIGDFSFHSANHARLN